MDLSSINEDIKLMIYDELIKIAEADEDWYVNIGADKSIKQSRMRAEKLEPW
jgi:hypothetical protein